MYQLRGFFSAGRNKLYVAFVSLAWGILAAVYLFKGPDEPPPWILHMIAKASVQEADDDASEATSEASEGSSEAGWSAPVRATPKRAAQDPAEAAEVAKLTEEMQEIRGLLRSLASQSPTPLPPPEAAPTQGSFPEPVPAPDPSGDAMQALLNFANDIPASGPFPMSQRDKACLLEVWGRPRQRNLQRSRALRRRHSRCLWNWPWPLRLLLQQLQLQQRDGIRCSTREERLNRPKLSFRSWYSGRLRSL